MTGRGTGIDDATLARKVAVVEAGARPACAPAPDRSSVLAEVGGLEIAALAGFIVGGAAAIGCPWWSTASSRCAGSLRRRVARPGRARLLSSPATARPSRARRPPSTTSASSRCSTSSLRLGEGTGACLALPLLEAAARILGEMATFDAPASPTRIERWRRTRGC